MDDGFIANQTMIKLINAQKRGVNCCVLVDDLNYEVKKALKTKFELHGGKIHGINKFWKIFFQPKHALSRHHEKVISIDDTNFIGSANIQDRYGDFKYGQNWYWDSNCRLRNILGSEIRGYFFDMASYYKLKLSQNTANTTLIEKYDDLYPNSSHTRSKWSLMRS